MKYALNHPWKFTSWATAYRVGLSQLFVVVILELVNMAFMMNNETVSAIIKDFLALVIISDFDDYFFLTVDKTTMGTLIKEGEVEIGGRTLTLPRLTKIETTTSNRAPRDLLIGDGQAVFEDGAVTTYVRSNAYTMHNNERKVLLTFGDRGFWNGFWRIVYRFFAILFQAAWVYFAPFLVFWLSYLIPYWEGAYG